MCFIEIKPEVVSFAASSIEKKLLEEEMGPIKGGCSNQDDSPPGKTLSVNRRAIWNESH